LYRSKSIMEMLLSNIPFFVMGHHSKPLALLSLPHQTHADSVTQVFIKHYKGQGEE
jgi:hypothetical protein